MFQMVFLLLLYVLFKTMLNQKKMFFFPIFVFFLSQILNRLCILLIYIRNVMISQKYFVIFLNL